MTDKQSTVVVSRELLARATKIPSIAAQYADIVDRGRALAELCALLAATPERPDQGDSSWQWYAAKLEAVITWMRVNPTGIPKMPVRPGQPEQAVDVGQPVAYVTENPHCPEGMSDEVSEYLPVGTELYLHAQPPANGYVSRLAYEAMQAEVARLSSELPDKVDPDRLSNFIREIDGNHSLGAGRLAELIAEHLNAPQD